MQTEELKLRKCSTGKKAEVYGVVLREPSPCTDNLQGLRDWGEREEVVRGGGGGDGAGLLSAALTRPLTR